MGEETNTDKEKLRDPIIKSEFGRELKGLENNKASAIDLIQAEILKLAGNEATIRLFKLTTFTHETGRIPEDSKKSIIVPLLQKVKIDGKLSYN